MDIKELHQSQRKGQSDIVDHLPTLYDAVITRYAQQVIETGIRGGNTTAALLAALEETGGRLWSVDILPPGAPIRQYKDHPQWDYVIEDEFDALSKAPAKCEVLMVDTEHNYQHVKRELEAYGPKVAPGGVIFVHDTENAGVLRACQEYAKQIGAEFHNDQRSHGFATISLPGELEHTSVGENPYINPDDLKPEYRQVLRPVKFVSFGSSVYHIAVDNQTACGRDLDGAEVVDPTEDMRLCKRCGQM